MSFKAFEPTSTKHFLILAYRKCSIELSSTENTFLTSPYRALVLVWTWTETGLLISHLRCPLGFGL